MDLFPVRRTQLFAAPSVVLAPTIQSRWGWVSWWRARGSFHNTHCQALPSLVTSRGAVEIYFACCCDIVSQDLDWPSQWFFDVYPPLGKILHLFVRVFHELVLNFAVPCRKAITHQTDQFSENFQRLWQRGGGVSSESKISIKKSHPFWWEMAALGKKNCNFKIVSVLHKSVLKMLSETFLPHGTTEFNLWRWWVIIVNNNNQSCRLIDISTMDPLVEAQDKTQVSFINRRWG